MTPTLRRLVADHGMVLVLLALCAACSLLTLEEQPATGGAAAAPMAERILRDSPAPPRVLIVVRDRPEDEAFAAALGGAVTAAGATVVETVRGEPPAARAVIERLAAAGEKVDVVATTPTTGSWLLLADPARDFSGLGSPVVVRPAAGRWPTFLKPENLRNIANQIAVIAIMAIGMTLVIVAGGIDLSVGSLAALSSVLATRLIRDAAGGVDAGAGGMLLSCLAAIAACGLVGMLTAALVTRFDVPPFIVTLAMMLVASGLAFLVSDGQSIYQVPDAFVRLGRGADLGGLPNAVVLMLLLYAAAHVLMSRTALGRWIYAVGGNREAARLSGVPVERVLFVVYVTSGLLAGLGGVIMASLLKSGSPTYGTMYELYVIAAVVVGGTALSGGEGKVLGTLVGALIIAVIQNGMNLMNIESYTQKVVLGLVILAAVLVDRMRHR
jgi:ribose transport system permease protein